MTKILILGGGFGGVRVALDLYKKLGHRKDVRITLLDRNDAQIFLPALYELASIYGANHEHPFHTKLSGMIRIPYSDIFRGKNVELIQAEINHLDIKSKHLVTNNGATIGFDFLVLALGAVISTFGIPGVEEYAHKFNNIEDGLMLNDKLEQLYTEAGQKKRPLPVNILIGGAGFNGVELAAELANCIVHMARRCTIGGENHTAVTLIEAGPFILPTVSDKDRGIIENRLKRLGVNILTSSPIEEVGSGYAKLKNGHILKGDLIVWSGGVKAPGLLKNIADLELDEHGKVLVDEFMQAKNHSNVFAVGDNIVFIDSKTGKPIPQLAYIAIEEGRVVAENIMIKLASGDGALRRLRGYTPAYKSWIASVGGKSAIARVGEWRFSGFLGYAIKQLTNLRYFLSVLSFPSALKLFFEEIRAFSKND